jgi:micrococcal nuclease
MSAPRRFARLAALALLVAAPIAEAAELAPEEAGRHLGETATVCGTVASARFSSRSASQPTFLNLGRPYPDQVFTIVIFGRDRGKFGTPESSLLRKRVCASGTITQYRGRAEMVVSEPAQLAPAE